MTKQFTSDPFESVTQASVHATHRATNNSSASVAASSRTSVHQLVLEVNEVHCKIGNKRFVFQLDGT